MARPHDPARGRQPFSPPATEIERSKVRVALSEAEQWSQRRRNRRLIRDARRLEARFESLRAGLRTLQDDVHARRELWKDAAEAFEQVAKFFTSREVQQAIPAEAAKAVTTARDLRGAFHATCGIHEARPAEARVMVPAPGPRGHGASPHPSPIPIDAMLVVLAAAAALLKRKLAG